MLLRKIMPTLRKTAATVVAALVVLVGVAAVPAQAATANCVVEYMCYWTDNDYAGFSDGKSAEYWSLSGDSFNNTANSVHVNGRTCLSGYYYNLGDRTGEYIWFYSDYLTTAGINRDPALSNGGGYGPYNGQGWMNVISSGKFYNC